MGDSDGGLLEMSKDDEMIGARFGKLLVVEKAGVHKQPNGRTNSRWLCQCDCGNTSKPMRGDLKKGNTSSCGSCKDKKEGGYVRVQKKNHPNAWKCGYMFEHTLVMSEILGRALEEDENVHHINGIRDDNRPENLELWTRPQPVGIRAQDALKWAYEQIEKYEKGFGEALDLSNE